MLVNGKADVAAAENVRGYTPLEVAIYQGNADIVKTLINSDAYTGVPERSDRLPLLAASYLSLKKPKVHNLIVAKNREKIKKIVEKQDWFPQEVLIVSFLEDMAVLKWLVIEYAHYSSQDRFENRLIVQQIERNKREWLKQQQQLLEKMNRKAK